MFVECRRSDSLLKNIGYVGEKVILDFMIILYWELLYSFMFVYYIIIDCNNIFCSL